MNITGGQISDQTPTPIYQFSPDPRIFPLAGTEFKVIACIDMDAFYAAAEAIRMGYDETVPVVVIQWKGCIAVSYAARKCGVTRFMKIEEIKKVCPQAVFIHVDTIKLGQPYIDPYKRDLREKFIINRDRDKEKVSLDYYRFESDKVISIFRKYCGIVEKASIDESFFDLTEEVSEIYKKGEYSKDWEGRIAGGDIFQPEAKEDIFLLIGSQLTNKIRNEVKQTLKYTCSAGISYNKMLAKAASGMNKPNLQTIIVNKYAQKALYIVDIPKLRNFGGKIADAFQAIGLKTLGDIQQLSLENIISVVKDEHCAKWVYFRCRGFDDEVVEEKDYTNKSLLSNKSFDRLVTNILDLENVEDLILSDLYSRMLKFYKENNMVPSTLNLHYYDNKTHERRTKSGPINLKVKEDKFYDLLKAKTQELIKQVANVIFPCKFLGVSAKNFQKNDVKSYEFDLITYAKEKQKQKELEKEKEIERIRLLEKENEKTFSKMIIEEVESHKDQLKQNSILDNNMKEFVKLNDLHNSLEFVNQESFQITSLNFPTNEDRPNCFEEDGKKIEETKCEKCGVLIPELQLRSHDDFHVAQELDKELNPNKRKYRKVQSGEVRANFQGEEYSQKDVHKIIENKFINQPDKFIDPPRKNILNKEVKNKNNGEKKNMVQMRSLDTFFRKK